MPREQLLRRAQAERNDAVAALEEIERQAGSLREALSHDSFDPRWRGEMGVLAVQVANLMYLIGRLEAEVHRAR